MAAVGEEAGVIANEISRNEDTKRTRLKLLGAMPRRRVAGLRQVEARRRQRVRCAGTENREGGEASAAQAEVPGRTDNPAGEVG